MRQAVAKTPELKRDKIVSARLDHETLKKLEKLQVHIGQKVGLKGVTMSDAINYCINNGAALVG